MPTETAKALVDEVDGRAVILHGNDTYVLDSTWEGPRLAGSTHLGMFMQSSGSEPKEQEVDEDFPFPVLHESLRVSSYNHASFMSFLMCLSSIADPGGISKETLDGLLRECEETLEESEPVRTFIRDKLLSKKLRDMSVYDKLPTTPRIAEIVRAVKEKWG